MPSLFLSPSVSFSVPQFPLRSSQLGYCFNNTHNNNDSIRAQQGKLLLLATLTVSGNHSASSKSGKPVNKNDRLPSKVLHFHEENSRSRAKIEEKRDQNLLKEHGRLRNKLEVENVDSIDKNEKMRTKKEKEFVESVKKDNEVPFKEQDAEIVISDTEDDKLQVLEFVERIKNLPSGERNEIIDFLKKGGGFPTLSDFNNLLKALVKSEEPEIAEKLFFKFPSYGLVPNSRTFSIMIKSYCNKNDPDGAKLFLDRMIEYGFPQNVVTFTILIDSFCRKGKLQKAFQVFEVMSRIGCEPMVETYNCLINGLCYVGRVEEAFDLLLKLNKSSKKPDIYTYTIVMDGFCKVGRSDEAMELLEEALERGLKPNVITFNTLLNGYGKEGRPLEGINLLQKMKERDCCPDYISYSTLLHGLLKWREISKALMIYKEMLGIGFEVEERMMNTLLRGICGRLWREKELLKDAEEVFERIKNADSVPHLSTYCLMIQVFCITGEIDKAFFNLQEMVRIGYPPWTITFNNVIRALCSKGRIDDALLVLVLMFNGGVIPGRISYNLLIHELRRQGKLFGAGEVYGAAIKRGVILHCKPRETDHG